MCQMKTRTGKLEKVGKLKSKVDKTMVVLVNYMAMNCRY